MTAVLAFAIAIVIAIWKAVQREPVPWTFLILLVLAGIILLTIAIIKISKTHARAHRNHTPYDDQVTRPNIPSPLAKECFKRAARLIKGKEDGIIMSFHGLYRARAYDLESNEDLVWVCDKLIAHGSSHPFQGLDECMPQSEWLDFMKWGHLHAKWDFGRGGGYLYAAPEWSNKKGRPCNEKKVWRGVTAQGLDEDQYNLIKPPW